MAAETVIRAIITAVDRFSGPVRGIVASAQGPLMAFGRLGPALANVSTQMAGLLGPLAMVGGALSAAGIAKAVKDFSEYGGEVKDTALRLGVSTKALQEYRYAAAESGLQNGVLEDGIVKLNKAIMDVALGAAPLAKETFRQFGIEWQAADGRLRTADEVLPELIKGFERIKGGGERAAVATALLGESGERLIPFLAAGTKEIDKHREAANRLGRVWDDDALDGADAFSKDVGKLVTALGGLAMTLGAALIPVLQPFVTMMKGWAEANRELIAQKIERIVSSFAEALAGVDWGAIFSAIASIGGAIATVADWLGPTGSLVAALGFAFAPLILAFGQLGWGILVAGAAAAKFGLAVVGITPFIGAFFTSLKAGFAIFEALKLAMMLNPFGALATAILAIIGLGVLLYRNWDEVVQFLSRSWDWMRQQIASLMGTVLDFAASLANLLPDWMGGKGLKASIEERQVAIRDWAQSAPGGNAMDQERGIAGSRGGLLEAAPEQRVGGEIVVKLEGAPPGTSVESVQGSGGIDIGVDIGRQPYPMGA